MKKRKTTDNERFHASGGVCPQTVLWEFGSLSPARTFVPPRLREAATTLAAMQDDSVVEKVVCTENRVQADKVVE